MQPFLIEDTLALAEYKPFSAHKKVRSQGVLKSSLCIWKLASQKVTEEIDTAEEKEKLKHKSTGTERKLTQKEFKNVKERVCGYTICV